MSTIPERQDAVNPSAPDAGVRTPAGDALGGLVARILRLNGALAAAGERLTRPAGQTSARWQVLAMVEDEPHTVAEIARTLGLARQSVQRVADALEAGGFVRYAPNPRHARAQLVLLTDAGRASLSAIQAAQRPWADAIGARVGERELRRANAVLDKVLAALEPPRRR